MKTFEGTRLIGLLLVLAVAQLTLVVVPTHAQQDGFPPWPIIYDGRVFVDGGPLREGSLTARVGDWESLPVPVVNGVFRCADPCLIVGPPDLSYLGEPVSFHLTSEADAAHLRYDFPSMESPLRETVDLFFGGVPATRTASYWIVLLVGGLVAVGGVSFGLYRWLLRPAGSRP